VKETAVLQSTALDAISSSFKILLFVIPSTLVELFFPHGRYHYVLFGTSFIGGALLQTLYPLRTYWLSQIFGLAIAAAVAIPVIAHFAGWN
jgi:hypothetical protein